MREVDETIGRRRRDLSHGFLDRLARGVLSLGFTEHQNLGHECLEVLVQVRELSAIFGIVASKNRCPSPYSVPAIATGAITGAVCID